MLFSIFHCLVGPAPGTVYYMGTTMTDVGTITVRLDEGDEELLDELAKRHGSRSDAIRAAIRELSGHERRQEALAKLVEEWNAEFGEPTQEELDRIDKLYFQ